MHISEKIQDWLAKNGSVAQGVELLKAVGGKHQSFEALLKRPGITAADKDRLRAALQPYAAAAHPPTPVEDILPSAYLSKNRDEPEAVRQLRAKARILHQSQNLAHAKLKAATTDEDRLPLAKEIMEQIVPALDAVYEHIRNWEQHAILPPMPGADEIVRDTVQKFKRRESLRTTITRTARMLNGIEDKDEAQQLKQQLQTYEAEYEALNKYLGLCENSAEQ